MHTSTSEEQLHGGRAETEKRNAQPCEDEKERNCRQREQLVQRSQYWDGHEILMDDYYPSGEKAQKSPGQCAQQLECWPHMEGSWV